MSKPKKVKKWGLTAEQLPSGNYRCRVCSDGEKRSFTSPSADVCLNNALDWKRTRKSKLNPDNKTVADAMTEYINVRRNILSPATIGGYEKQQRLYFQDVQRMRIDKVTNNHIQAEINRMAADGLSAKTIANTYNLIKAACCFDYNPTMPKKKKLKYNTPGTEQIKIIFQAIKGTDIEIPVLLALFCGLRMSEVRGLKFSKVFPDHIHIDNAIVDVDGKHVEKGTKTVESERDIAIDDFLYEKIMALPHDTEYVTNKTASAITNKFRRRTGGICTFHELRHANASIMHMLNIPKADALARGGWSDSATMERVYIQAVPESQKESDKKVNNKFKELYGE